MFDFNIDLTKLKQEVAQKRGLSPRQHETTKPEIKLSDFASACDSLSRLITTIDQRKNNVVKSEQRDNPSAQLENCTECALDACHKNKEGNPMASKHRLRAVIGYDETGEQIIRQINGKTEIDLADEIVRAFINSGRISEFLPDIYNRFGIIHDPEPEEESQKHLMSEYVPYWRETYKQGGEKSTQVFRDAKQSVILRYFGEMYVEDIQPDTVQQFLNYRAFEDGMKKATVKADWAFLREIMECAVRDGLINTNPAKDMRLKNNAEAGEGTLALSPDQYKSVRSSVEVLQDETERVTLALFAYTSFRLEEALALKWSDVDFETNTIHVHSALTFVNGKADQKKTKTKESKRDFPMGEKLRSILFAAKRENGYIISGSSDGEHITEARFYRMWNRIGRQVDLYGTTPINFRTTFATVGIAAGVDPRTMAKLMGHSNTDTTMNVYSKVVECQLPMAVNMLNTYLA